MCLRGTPDCAYTGNLKHLQESYHIKRTKNNSVFLRLSAFSVVYGWIFIENNQYPGNKYEMVENCR